MNQLESSNPTWQEQYENQLQQGITLEMLLRKLDDEWDTQRVKAYIEAFEKGDSMNELDQLDQNVLEHMHYREKQQYILHMKDHQKQK